MSVFVSIVFEGHQNGHGHLCSMCKETSKAICYSPKQRSGRIHRYTDKEHNKRKRSFSHPYRAYFMTATCSDHEIDDPQIRTYEMTSTFYRSYVNRLRV